MWLAGLCSLSLLPRLDDGRMCELTFICHKMLTCVSERRLRLVSKWAGLTPRPLCSWQRLTTAGNSLEAGNAVLVQAISKIGLGNPLVSVVSLLSKLSPRNVVAGEIMKLLERC